MSSNGREQVQFWRELERIEQWLGTGAGAAAGRIYDTMGRPGQQTFVNYGNELIAGVARVERVRQALDQSGPVAKRLAMQQLSGIGLSDVWDILIAACKEIALYHGGAVVAGAVVGGAIGSLAFGAGAVPGAIAGGAAGSQVGLWVLTLLGLKDLAVGLTTMFPAAMEHYERGFREAWGPVPDNRHAFGIGAAQPSGSSSAGAWHMGQGHVILVTAILTAVVAYLTRGGTTASLAEMARQSRSLGAKFGNWAVKNEGKLLAHPHLQSRPNNSVAMAMDETVPSSRHGTSTSGNTRVDSVGTRSTVLFTEKSVFASYPERTTLQMSSVSEQIEFFAKHVPGISKSQAASILESGFSRDTSVVLGGSRIRGNFNVSSDLDVGFGSLTERQAQRVVKSINEQGFDVPLERLTIVPGKSTPTIERIISPEEFFQRAGVRAGGDLRAGQPYIPSGSIAFTKDGRIEIIPSGKL